MEIAYDPVKNAKNVRERGLSFERARQFDFGTAEIHSVWQHDELRFLATGFLEERLHVVVFTKAEDALRVISFRKANRREVRGYEASRRDLESGA